MSYFAIADCLTNVVAWFAFRSWRLATYCAWSHSSAPSSTSLASTSFMRDSHRKKIRRQQQP